MPEIPLTPIGPGKGSDLNLREVINAVGSQTKKSYQKIQDIMKKEDNIDSQDMINAQLEMTKFLQLSELGSSCVSAGNSANMSPARGIKGQ